jgi:hypothetical protein
MEISEGDEPEMRIYIRDRFRQVRFKTCPHHLKKAEEFI